MDRLRKKTATGSSLSLPHAAMRLTPVAAAKKSGTDLGSA
jgi:hypothetical protein